jgi:hypothetical protein
MESMEKTTKPPMGKFSYWPRRSALVGAVIGLVAVAPPQVRAEILVSPSAGGTEEYAARELQNYFYKLTGTLLPVKQGNTPSGGNEPLCLIGSPKDWPALKSLVDGGQLAWSATEPGPQGYVLKTATVANRPALIIAGADPVGSLYGVYGLLEDHLGVSFLPDGDVLVPQKAFSAWPALDEKKTPLVAIRGVLPWVNFPQSATSYSWEDWRFIIDQMTRMRMNFLLIHNYNGECDHNEMFHNFEVDGKMTRSWMATARSGHSWGGKPGWDVNRYLFGAADLFDDYDFGSECALHNERLSNRQVFRKGANLFQRVIAYAHQRGVRIGLGLDIDKIMRPAYSGSLRADDPRVIEARCRQITSDYPDLDYLFCFQSETLGGSPEAKKTWRAIFDAFHEKIRKASPQTRFAVAGWGISDKDVATLPPDVICAPIAPYSAKFENGAIYGEREYWGCPWLERDLLSSVYYYPYNIDLADTLATWRNRAPNLKGLYCLTWRLADAISPKLWYIARAPWDTADAYKTSEAVYRDYAQRSYGRAAAPEVTAIINSNEPLASLASECGWTPEFEASDEGKSLFNVNSLGLSGEGVAEWRTTGSASVYKQGSKAIGPVLGYIDHGNWAIYRLAAGQTFSPKWTTFRASVASATAGGRIEIKLGGPDGKKLGDCLVPVTGDFVKSVDITATLTVPEAKELAEAESVCLVFSSRNTVDNLAKAEEQLKTLDRCIAGAETAGQKQRLEYVHHRIAAARDHILLNTKFSAMKWQDFPGPMESWAHHFIGRVTDISTLGNVVSMQNRYVQKNYLVGLEQLKLTVKGVPSGLSSVIPSDLQARGTADGALLTWSLARLGARGFHVYRDGRKVSERPLPPEARSYLDRANGRFRYTVTAVEFDDGESLASLPVTCEAGQGDKTPPRIVVISPPTTAMAGQPVWIKARLLDNRVYELLSATLCYRQPGAATWTRMPMTRRIKSTFVAVIPASAVTRDGLEYFIEAGDGASQSVYPITAPVQAASLTVTAESPSAKAPGAVKVKVAERKLSWSPVAGATQYRIYRAEDKKFTAGPATWLTYVAADAELSFTDNGEDLAGRVMTGDWCYRVTAVDKDGREGPPSASVAVCYEALGK